MLWKMLEDAVAGANRADPSHLVAVLGTLVNIAATATGMTWIYNPNSDNNRKTSLVENPLL